VLKGDLIFADEEGVPRGHPQWRSVTKSKEGAKKIGYQRNYSRIFLTGLC
jgi:hypothetical protein